jgi:transposase
MSRRMVNEQIAVRWYSEYLSGRCKSQIEVARRFKVHKTTVCRWFGTIAKSTELVEQAKAICGSKGSVAQVKQLTVKRNKASISDMQAVLDENDYLKWALMGERKGWLDKLLKEYN